MTPGRRELTKAPAASGSLGPGAVRTESEAGAKFAYTHRCRPATIPTMADDELPRPRTIPMSTSPIRDWEAEATKWKALARKHERAAKDYADGARRLAEIERSGKS
jgi:hypothetical protein